MQISATEWPRGWFTIGRLMIAIAFLAGLLALPAEVGVIVIGLSIPCLSLIGAQWLVFRRRRRVAAYSFWVAATLTNLLAAFSCIAPNSYALIAIILGLFVTAIPSTSAFGAAWVRLLTREAWVRPRSRAAAGISVFVLAMLPILTLWTFWPLHMAFLAARPGMERLADQVAVGKTVGFPRRAGLFLVVASAVDPVSGDVSLMIDPNPNGPTGFVRASPGALPSPNSSIVGSNLNVNLGGGWWYREDD